MSRFTLHEYVMCAVVVFICDVVLRCRLSDATYLHRVVSHYTRVTGLRNAIWYKCWGLGVGYSSWCTILNPGNIPHVSSRVRYLAKCSVSYFSWLSRPTTTESTLCTTSRNSSVNASLQSCSRMINSPPRRKIELMFAMNCISSMWWRVTKSRIMSTLSNANG